MNTPPEDLQHLLLSRRTIHDFLPDPIPEDLLLHAIEAASRAPNHKITNPWRFTKLGPLARASLTDLAISLKAADASPQKQASVRAKFNSPPILLVASQIVSQDPHRAHEDYAACACAIQNLSLSLWAHGIGSKWSSGAITTHPDTYSLAHISPPEHIIGFIWIGRPDHLPPPTPRLPTSSILRHVP
jgi:nitroreductase